MGRDKATLPVDGVPQAERIVKLLSEAGIPVTVLGQEPVAGANFLKDLEAFGGPLAALSRFVPTCETVFVCSCDLPRFDGRIPGLLARRMGGADVAAPFIDGFRQPLCALYRASAFERLSSLVASGRECAMAWLDELEAVLLSEAEFLAAGINPASMRGANTPEELERALSEA